MTPWLVVVTLSLALLEPGTCFHERFGRNMRGDTMYNVADAGNIHTENHFRKFKDNHLLRLRDDAGTGKAETRRSIHI